MARKMELTLEVDFLYEMEVKHPKKTFDQREGGYYTTYVNETKLFHSIEAAEKWLSKNEGAEVVSFVRIENCLDMLKGSK